MNKIWDLLKEKKSDLFAYQNFEVKAAFFVSFVLTCIIIIIGMYNDFSSYIEGLKNLILYVMQAFIGLLGTILAGLSIMLFLFTSKGLEKIGQKNGTGHKMLLSYVFLCLNIVFAISLLIVLFFVIMIPKSLVNIISFIFICFFTIYYVFFILFYTVALINNAVVLFKIDTIMRSGLSDKELIDTVVQDIIERIRIYLSLNTKKRVITFIDIKKVIEKTINSLESTRELHGLNKKLINDIIEYEELIGIEEVKKIVETKVIVAIKNKDKVKEIKKIKEIKEDKEIQTKIEIVEIKKIKELVLKKTIDYFGYLK